MALYTAYQGTPAAPCGNMLACSAGSLSSQPINCEIAAVADAPRDAVMGVNGNSILRRAMFNQSKAGEPGVATWKAGVWTVRMHSLEGFLFTWDEVHICRVSSLCALVGTVATRVGLAIDIFDSDVVYSTTVTQTLDSVGDPSDQIYIVYGLKKIGPGSQLHTFRFDQLIETPIELEPPAAPGLVYPPQVAAAHARADGNRAWQ